MSNATKPFAEIDLDVLSSVVGGMHEPPVPPPTNPSVRGKVGKACMYGGLLWGCLFPGHVEGPDPVPSGGLGPRIEQPAPAPKGGILGNPPPPPKFSPLLVH